jgi:SAM-dependent methyltransferase
MSMVGRWLQHPLTRGLDPDHPETTTIRRQVVDSKPFLRKIYLEWYERLLEGLPAVEGHILELGSGAGFFRELCPSAISSELFRCDGIQSVIDARRLPVRDGSLRSIVMTDVMHHIPDPARFLAEAQRALVPGGRVLMIEPWVSAWSKFVYMRFHSEPFRPEASAWEFPSTGPLSGANGAIPWMIFHRDVERFRRLFPRLIVTRVEPFMPFRYVLSGGVSMRAVTPAWSFGLWRGIEKLLEPWMHHLAMFAFIAIERR